MKLKIKNIISDRNFETWVSYQLIYEWEDELSRTLQIPIINNPIDSKQIWSTGLDTTYQSEFHIL